MREKQSQRVCSLAANLKDWSAGLVDDADKIRHKRKLNVSWIARRMSHSMAEFALHAFFVDRDPNESRQYFYTAALLRLYGISQNTSPAFNSSLTTIPPFLYPLLSNDNHVIIIYSNVENQYFSKTIKEPTRESLEISMIQASMGNRDDELSEYINITRHQRTRIAKGPRKSNFCIIRGSPMEDFFEALLWRDKEKLQTLVQRYYINNSKDAIFEDLLSVDGCIRTKLCWRRGIEIRPISPLIPLDLMPIEPLEHYRYEYDFLEPGWTPPRQGWLGDFERFIKRKLATLCR